MGWMDAAHPELRARPPFLATGKVQHGLTPMRMLVLQFLEPKLHLGGCNGVIGFQGLRGDQSDSADGDFDTRWRSSRIITGIAKGTPSSRSVG